MELRDFKIGDRFYTGSGSWVCVDVGSRSILAVKELPAYSELQKIYHVGSPKPNDIVKYYDLLPTMSFFPDDFGGCDKKDRFTKQTNAATAKGLFSPSSCSHKNTELNMSLGITYCKDCGQGIC